MGNHAERIAGHSVASMQALVVGVFDLETGLALISQRAQLIQSLPLDGAMLAVMTTADDATSGSRRTPRQYRAATTGPQHRHRGAREQPNRCKRPGEGGGGRFLPVSHAFHSPLLDPIVERFNVCRASIIRHPTCCG